MAYDTWLINPTTAGNNTYVSAINGGTNTLKTIERKGNMSSTELALSGNYMNKLYIGGSIGIPNLRYEEMSQHVENVANDTINDLDNFTFTQTLKTTGSGFNFKIGFVNFSHNQITARFVNSGLQSITPSVHGIFFRDNSDPAAASKIKDVLG